MPSEAKLPEHDEPVDCDPAVGDDAPPEEPVEPYGDDGEPVRWVTIGTFWNASEAHLARLRVEAEGIDSVLLDEFLVATDWLYANAAGGIKLQVPQADEVRARDLLARVTAQQSARHDDELDGDIAEKARSTASSGVCPRCGSMDVYRAWFSRRVFFGMFLFGIALPLPIPAWRCRDCSSEWWRRRERWHRLGRVGFEVVRTPDEKPAG